jgi:hypothetical protein
MFLSVSTEWTDFIISHYISTKSVPGTHRHFYDRLILPPYISTKSVPGTLQECTGFSILRTTKKRTFSDLLTTLILIRPWCIRPPQRRFEQEVSCAVPFACIAEQDERIVFDVAFLFEEKTRKLCCWHLVDC